MDDLSLKKAVETAVAMETATRDAAELQSMTSNMNVIDRKRPIRRREIKPRQKPASTCPALKQNVNVSTVVKITMHH